MNSLEIVQRLYGVVCFMEEEKESGIKFQLYQLTILSNI
jgi:hypothetical protein